MYRGDNTVIICLCMLYSVPSFLYHCFCTLCVCFLFVGGTPIIKTKSKQLDDFSLAEFSTG